MPAADVPTRDVVVLGASAGGVEALKRVVSGLPRSFRAAVLVVLHMAPNAPTALPSILGKSGALPVFPATDGDVVVPGRIYVAAPNRHLVLDSDGTLHLTQGPRENGHRPAVDVLFRSAARSFGSRVIGVVLSGSLDDGTAGLVAIRESGGVTIAQDPEDALYPGMPTSAIATMSPDHVDTADRLGPLLAKLVNGAGGGPRGDQQEPLVEKETAMAELDPRAVLQDDPAGEPSGYTCPDCQGSLYVVPDQITRFRCRVGHAWSPESLGVQQSIAIESALWMALRALHEKRDLNREMAGQARQQGRDLVADTFQRRADEAATSAEHLVGLIGQIADHNADVPGSEAG